MNTDEIAEEYTRNIYKTIESCLRDSLKKIGIDETNLESDKLTTINQGGITDYYYGSTLLVRVEESNSYIPKTIIRAAV